jgi:ATP-dependent metalloprotease
MLLKTHEKELHALAKELLDKETLTGAQIREVLMKNGGRGAAAAS